MATQRKRKKKPRRRSQFAWFYKLLAVLTVLCAVTVGATVFFQVEEVEVLGNQHYTPEELVTTSGIVRGDNLFTLPRSGIASSMEESLPYLESVEIDLKLPNAICITVEEWEAVASVETDTGDWLISVGGKILETGTHQNLVITGLDVLLPKAGSFVALPLEDVEKENSLMSLLAALEEGDILSLVSHIDMEESTTLTMTYGGRFQVILPINGDYGYELQVLESAIGHYGDQERGTFDMTQQDYQAVYTPEGLT